MDSPDSNAVEFERARAAALKAQERARADQLATIGLDARLWIAVTPFWTVGLADACRLPVGRGDTPADAIARLERLGLIERAEPPIVIRSEARAGSDAALTRFWMSDRARAEYQTQSGSRLGLVARTVARRVLQVSRERRKEPGRLVPQATWRWAQLATLIHDTVAVERRFGQRFRTALDDERPDEARAWLQALVPLDPLVGGRLTITAQRAMRALTLFERRTNDLAYLRHYLVRDDQLGAYRELVDGPADLYALHYLGGGGVGKTMLMRYLTSSGRPALSDGRALPPRTAARIDFDYLNPDYPAKRPGLLLTQLAEELRVKDVEGKAARIFERDFYRKVALVNQRIDLSKERHGRAGGDIERLLSEPLNVFAEACRRLAAPPLLILDTCEELARLGADNRVPDSVNRTFELLDALHRRLPELRVVFCGRRLLASEYAGTGRIADPALLPRKHVRLHEILAFTAVEGTRLLKQEGVPRELVRPILERSRAAGYRPIRPDPTPIRRYSPFSVALYAGWVRHRPELTPHEILNDPVDQFVRIRILERIRNASVRDALPAVALLGRFDLGMLQAALGASSLQAGQILQELAREEWIDRQASGFLQIEAELRDRLRRHFESETHRGELGHARLRLITYLEAQTLQPAASTLDTGRLDLAHPDMLARLLETEPDRAAHWWAQLEERAAQARAFAWLEKVTAQMLAPGGALAERDRTRPSHPLRVAALMTLGAAKLQLGKPDGDEPYTWAEWSLLVDTLPEDVVHAVHRFAATGGWRMPAAWRLRGCAGSVASGNMTMILGMQRHLRQSSGRAPRVALPALLAATERIVEEWERGSFDPPAPPDQQELGRIGLEISATWPGAGPDAWPVDLKSFVLVVQARAAKLSGRLANARQLFLDVRNRIVNSDVPVPPVGYLDWVAPADPGCRLRLEFLRGVYPGLLSPRQALNAWVGDARGDSIDADRLQSAVLLLTAAVEPPRVGTFEDSGEELAEVQCEAHRAFPPSFIVRAELLAARGDVNSGFRRIDGFVSRALRAQRSALAQDARLARCRVARRMRLPVSNDAVALDALKPDDLLLVAAYDGLTRTTPGASSIEPSDAWRAHAVFRATSADAQDLLTQACRWFPSATTVSAPIPSQPARAHLEASLWLDAVELDDLELPELSPIGLGFDGSDALRAAALARVQQILPILKGQPHHRLRLLLRLEALDLPVADLDVRSAMDDTGCRRAAEIACDEGELLALRLPEQALTILRRARAWFAEVSDPVGVLLVASCESCACLAADLADEARNALAEAQRAYSQVAEQVVSTRGSSPERSLSWGEQRLPFTPWSDLEATGADPTEARLAELQPLGWRSWQLRLVACLAHLGVGNVAARLAAAETAMGYDGQMPELARLFRGMRQSSVASPQPAAPEAQHEGPAVDTPPRIRVESDSSQVALPIEPHPGRLTVLGEDGVVRYQCAFRPLDRTEEFSLSLLIRGNHWRHVLAWPADAGIDQAPVVDLVLDRSHTWISWEAILPFVWRQWPAHPAYGRIDDVPVFRRMVPRHSTSRPQSPPAATLGLDIAAPTYLQSWLRDVWRPLFEDPWVVVQTPRFDEMVYRGRSFPTPGHVLVLVCSPLETSSGVVLRVKDERFHSDDPSALLQASQLTRWSPDVSLVVLQATPLEEPQWDRSERETLGLLRAFGAELFALGVPSVLVLPPAAHDMMARVWEALSSLLLTPTPNLHRCAAAQRELRQALWTGAEAWPIQDRIEASLSVVWYSADYVPWPGVAPRHTAAFGDETRKS